MRKTRWLVPIIIVTSVAILGILAVRAISAPSHGHATNSGGKIAAQHIKPPIPRRFDTAANNAYYDLSLPTGYTSQSVSQATPGLLYQQTIIKSAAGGSHIISVTIQSLSATGLTELSAYQLRSSQPGRYQLTTVQSKGQPIQVARDLQSASVVAFWVHGSTVATIAVTTALAEATDAGGQNELRTLQPILDAWQWR